MLDPNKPQWQSSEFWLTIVKISIPLLVGTGVIKPGDSATLEGALTNMVATAFSFIGAAWVVATYIKGRVDLKKTHIENGFH